ncbi:cell envelope integrity protein TolA [Chlorobium sp. BLA1]|uniref:energy transducer TonB n=1 Tax=Candidatus Chlorobium masyuteum TaxID=2716876 RepID=UPI0014209BE8|nr:TonB C-terminal domain-containing protein [Candidatus Chlorobium masyuteum]NHQ60617.1 cell envelope integrity protein TolA [Candidatus Chlorobium masyuteum]
MKTAQKRVPAEKKFFFWLAAAAAMHLLLFIFALYLQMLDADRHAKPSRLVSVTLVSLSGPGGPAGFSEAPGEGSSLPAAQTVSEPPAPVEPKASQPAALLPPTPVQQKAKTISDVVAKPASKQDEINKAFERLKQVVAKSSPAPPKPSPAGSMGNLNKALAQLQQRVNAEGNPGGRGGSGSGGSGRGGGPYKAYIASIIQRNWEFSGKMLRSSYGMEVYVRIHILADGTINQIVIDRRAPSEYLNNSVKRALEKSSPLPVIPKEELARERERELWVGFVFTPEGIEK